MKQLVVEEILGRADDGMTRPFLCRLSDGETYYVKGRSANARGLINELVCALIGQRFALPIPPVAIADVPRALADFDPEVDASLGAGPAFASRKVDGLVAATSGSLHRFPVELQCRLFLFDRWINNEDRTLTEYGGNPNLFIEAASQEAVVIDHNLAFDPSFDLENNLEMHIFRLAWSSAQTDLFAIEKLRSDLRSALSSVPAALQELPEEWVVAVPGVRDQIMSTLSECEETPFWETLRG